MWGPSQIGYITYAVVGGHKQAKWLHNHYHQGVSNMGRE